MKIADNVFKSYDIRAIYPTDINEDLVYKVAQGYVKKFSPKKVVVGRDVRESGPQLHSATIKGFTDAGVDVIDIGIVSTDMFYFAVGELPVDGGVTLSASHNPREWNGMNFCKKGAEPVSLDGGLAEIRDMLLRDEEMNFGDVTQGTVEQADVMDDFLKRVTSFVKFSDFKPMKVVADPNFGMGGEILKRAVELFNLPLDVVYINGEPDGTFPKGHPNPLLPERRKELSDTVIAEKADFGVAWDADGDRVFFVDETGQFIEGYFTTALLATELLKQKPGGKVLIDPRLVWATTDAITKAGGEVIVTKPGMTLIADRMKKEDAIFAGEMSSHFYFPENYYRDNGFIPLFLILEMMNTYDQPLSALIRPHMEKYFISGELNFMTDKKDEIIDALKEKYADGNHEFIDGLSIAYDNWRFNVRKSNTENLLRLNLEAKSKEEMEEKRDEIIELITSMGGVLGH
jgi:phosphomannomutase